MSTRAKIPLSDFITLQRGFDLPTARRKEGNVPVIASTGITGYHNEAKVQGPGVVIGRSGSIGGGQYTADDFWPLNTTLWVKDFKGNNPRFTYYLLKGIDFTRFNAGAGVPTLNRNHIASLRVSRFSPAEQDCIASILSAYDDLIENNRRRIQLLEQAARLLYKEWFVRLHFPGHEHVKITDGVPEGWRRAPLQEVCKRITDGSHLSPKSVDEGVPMASVKDMHDWGFNTEQCRKISQQDFELLVRNDCKPLKNDVLIAKDGSYLKHTFVVQEEIDLVILSSIAILRPNHLIDPHLLNFILRDSRTKMRMTGYVSGVALPRIILKEFRGFEILLPPMELQRLWAIHAHPIAVQCHQLGKQNKSLAQARDLLLPRLMNGEVAV
jgi:type I restriction enzyme S subunit